MRVIIVGILLFGAIAMPMASAKDDDPCRGFWMYDEDFGHVRVYTNGNTQCTGADVLLPAVEQCVTDGDYYPLRTIGAVTFWEYRCGA